MARHRLDPVSLVAGLVCVVLGVLWFAGDGADFLARVAWVGPALLVAAGVVLVLGAQERR